MTKKYFDVTFKINGACTASVLAESEQDAISQVLKSLKEGDRVDFGLDYWEAETESIIDVNKSWRAS